MSDEKSKLAKVREIVCDKKAGSRCIVVLDRGWIFVGDLTIDGTTHTLTPVQNIRNWKQGGFGGLTRSAKASGATLDACEDITYDRLAEVFRVPVGEDWDA
jgi:hypothetical protein